MISHNIHIPFFEILQFWFDLKIAKNGHTPPKIIISNTPHKCKNKMSHTTGIGNKI
jgi:hypothetical protein